MKTTLLFSFILCTTFATAQQTYVPDDNFEQALIDLGYDNALDDYVFTANINTITYLDVSPGFEPQGSIQDLTGIEDFTALEELNVYLNQLTTLDLSQNINLKFLYCWGNQLSSLNISQCTLLKELEIGQNQLTNLDINQNTVLRKLLCGNNQLTSLSVTQNTALEIMNCAGNQLTSLDIRNGVNTIIQTFIAQNNPNLTCIFVEDSNYSKNNSNWKKDSTAHFVETQTECDALASVNEVSLQKIKIYPNPVKSILHINLEFEIQDSEIVLTTILGEKAYLATISGREAKINLSHLRAGVYFLTIKNYKEQSLTTKIIKL